MEGWPHAVNESVRESRLRLERDGLSPEVDIPVPRAGVAAAPHTDHIAIGRGVDGRLDVTRGHQPIREGVLMESVLGNVAGFRRRDQGKQCAHNHREQVLLGIT